MDKTASNYDEYHKLNGKSDMMEMTKEGDYLGRHFCGSDI